MAVKNPQKSLGTLGNYNLEDVIGEGSMGTVYRARHWQSQAVVAVKKMPAALVRNAVLLKRFEQEYRVASKLDHPNIVHMLEYSVENGVPFIVMELVEGESLGDRLAREIRLDEEEALRIIIQVSQGLHRAHVQGLIHRDVKPDNILLTNDGKAKLADLGLAKDLDAEIELTRTGGGLGTPNYMVPEQFRNAKHASIRCDIYSLGASLYHLVTGELPFGAGNPIQIMQRKLANDLVPARKLVPGLSQRTDWAIRLAMSADPEQRPPTCREFAEDLLGQSTRQSRQSEGESGPSGRWYLVFTDGEGATQTAHGSLEDVRQLLSQQNQEERNLARASKSPVGPFEFLHHCPEFRDLVAGPAPGPSLSQRTITRLGQVGHSAQGVRAPEELSLPAANEPEEQPEPVEGLTHEQPAIEEPAQGEYSELLRTCLLLALVTAASVLAGLYWLPQ